MIKAICLLPQKKNKVLDCHYTQNETEWEVSMTLNEMR